MVSELEALAAQLGACLLERGEWLVTAESCTGGWVAQSVTAIAGSSAWFDRGFVTYSNAAKTDMLGVAPSTLERHGAVSEATARPMAQGAIERPLVFNGNDVPGVMLSNAARTLALRLRHSDQELNL